MHNIDNREVKVLVSADTYSAALNLAGTDISNFEGNFLLHFNATIATAGTLTPTLQHNSVAAAGDAGWAAVPAAVIVNPETGEEQALTSVSGAAGTNTAQTRSIVRQRVKRYVRLALAVPAGTGEVAAFIVGQKKY